MLSTRKIPFRVVVAASAILLSAFKLSAAGPSSDSTPVPNSAQAWVGARIIDGTGKPAIENATLVIRNGHIEAVGKRVKVPTRAERIDARGKTIIPGLINAHGHLNSEDRLGVYLRDGITTILSLGGDKEFALREFCAKAPPGTVPRLYVAGPIQDSSAIPGAVVVTTPEQARKSVDELIRNKPDIIKVRIDDFRGARQKMSPEVYAAVIDEAHKNGFRTAAHIVFLDDAKGVLRAGVDYIAHSVRDQEVDGEFIALMKKRHVSYSPTLTRELAVFTYSEAPSFFSDPFFLKEADPAEIAQMRDPKRQDTMRSDPSAQWYKEHMPIAMRNLKKLSDAGINIAMGTDSGGGPGRFQGYFEHLELEYETKAGLTPMQALISATSGAAKALNISKQVGTLEKGKLADFVVLAANPLDDIKNTRVIESVWIGGVRVPAKK
jgi:imidazolonepropionase-like amidohydrolase